MALQAPIHNRPTIGMSGKDRAPRSCGDVDVELRRLTS
jgi:hypothetical protein